jgi:hypothetical protein
MRVLPVAPAVPFSGHTRGHDRVLPSGLSTRASTPQASDVIKRNSLVAA